jgi:hypothetical protein
VIGNVINHQTARLKGLVSEFGKQKDRRSGNPVMILSSRPKNRLGESYYLRILLSEFEKQGIADQAILLTVFPPLAYV